MQLSDTDLGPSLYGACGEFSLSGRAWRLLLALASAYGWEPVGTRPPDPEWCFDDEWSRMANVWDGRYLPSECQRMTENDAFAMADALEHALPDVPAHDALSDKVLASSVDELALWGRAGVPGVTIAAMEEFSGHNKPLLMSLIVHLREGGEIWIC